MSRRSRSQISCAVTALAIVVLLLGHAAVASAAGETLERFDPALGSSGEFTPVSGPLDPAKPSVVLVHGWNYTNSATLNDGSGWLWQATHSDSPGPGRLGVRSDLNVVAWNWLEEAKTGPYPGGVPDQKVQSEGRALKDALAANLGPTYQQPIHLIGHSLGGAVATYAALLLRQSGFNVDQVTLFDAPELETQLEIAVGRIICIRPLHLDRPLTRLIRLGVWVDSYASVFGKTYRYPGIMNVALERALKPTLRELSRATQRRGLRVLLPFVSAKIDDHFYAPAWYFGWPPSGQHRGDPSGTLDVDSGYPFVLGVPVERVGAVWSEVLTGASGIALRGNLRPGHWRMICVAYPYVLVPSWVP